MRQLIYMVMISSAVLLLAACNERQAPKSAAPPPDRTQGSMQHPVPTITEPPRRDYSFNDVVAGAKLFQQYCATCHGQQAEGHPRWRQPAAVKGPAAPPLNGTGHAWHHPKAGLMHTIKQGTGAIGGKMPAWKDKLTDAQIEQIIAWMQSRWPDEIYAAWQRTDEKARQRKPAR